MKNSASASVSSSLSVRWFANSATPAAGVRVAPSSVAGLCWRDEGRIVRGRAAPAIRDVDAIRETPRLRVVREPTEDTFRSSSPESSTTSSAPRPTESSTAGSTASSPGPQPAATFVAPLLALWLDVGFHVTAAALEAQQAMLQHWVRTPQVANIIRQQIALNDLATAHLAPAFPRAAAKR